MEDGNERYQVVLIYSTYAASPEEAVALAVEAVKAGNGAYAEVFPDSGEQAVAEGDLPDLQPKGAVPR